MFLLLFVSIMCMAQAGVLHTAQCSSLGPSLFHALSDWMQIALSGDADAEVKRLMGESAELTSAQQEAEAQLGQSKQIIQELQAALKSAQVLLHTLLQMLQIPADEAADL